MSTYQKILVAVDLSSESEVVLKKAQLIADTDAEIHLVYVQEPMDNVYVGIVPQSAAFSGLGDHCRGCYAFRYDNIIIEKHFKVLGRWLPINQSPRFYCTLLWI